MTVAEMLNCISSRELSEWMIFYGIEPFGFESDYLGHAQTSATLVNINKKKGSKQVTARDFFPKMESENEELHGAIGFASAITQMHGGEIKKHGTK